MSATGTKTVERGALFMSKPKRVTLEQVKAIAHENGRSEAEAAALLARASLLAAEQLIAMKRAGSE